MSASGRPLAAAPTSKDLSRDPGGYGNQDPHRNPSFGRRPKRTLIESACSACRRRKSKCDGARPVCSRCQALRTECIYEAQEGESRWSALRRQNKTMENERDELREILNFLQSQPEPEAQEMLQRIRSGGAQEALSNVLQFIRDRQGSAPSLSAPSTIAGQTRLPPIQTILDAPEGAATRIEREHYRRSSLASDGSGASYSSSRSGGEIATSQPPSA